MCTRIHTAPALQVIKLVARSSYIGMDLNSVVLVKLRNSGK